MSKYEFVISANDKTAQAFSSINKGIGGLARKAAGAATAVAGVTAAFSVWMNRSAQTAKELDTQARLAGENVERFQELSYAFGKFNIDQEKFADLSKDVQDKLGDFLATGAGPFADFFENVAWQVGLTAESLKNLSSTDVLIAVKKAMDDANVSAKEQVFYMEAIANDATLLLPALKNNGAAIKQYANEFDGLNAAMSQAEVDKLKDLANEFDRMEKLTTSMGNKLAASFAEPLADIMEVMDDGLTEHLMRGESAFKGMASGIFEVAAASAEMARWNPFAMIASGKSRAELDAQADHFRGFAAQLKGEARELDAQISELGNSNFGETDNIFAGMDDMFNIEGAATNIDTTPAATAAQNVRNTFLDNLSLVDEIAANSFNFSDAMEEGSNQFWTSFEERGFESYETMGAANDSFWQQWMESAQNQLQNFDELSAMTIESFSNQMGSALESMIFDSESLGDAMTGIMENVARSVVNALGQMAAQWLAYQLVQMAVGKTAAVAGAAGMTANAQAASLMAGINAFQSTAAIPMVGPVMAPAAMASALAVTQPMAAGVATLSSTAAVASFDGGGYTWDGPRVGGMDGKGGKLAMLHPREKITDLTKAASDTPSRGDVYVNLNVANGQPMDDRWWRNNRRNIEMSLAKGVRT